MITNYRKRTMKQAVAGTVIPLLLLAVSLTTFAQQQHEPISVDKAKMIGYVEDFFLHNYRDITMRKSLEWGEVATDEQGNTTIRYKFEALIWDKDRQIISEDFTFDKDGKFVASQKVDGFPQELEKPDTSTKEGMQKLVEKFFSQNYRDITKRKTLEWGEPETMMDGLRFILYKYEATIGDKDIITQNMMFVFTKNGEFVSVRDVKEPDSAQIAALAIQKAAEGENVPLRPVTYETGLEILSKLKSLEEMILELKQELKKRDFEPLTPVQPKIPPRDMRNLQPTVEFVWDKFGLRVESVKQEEFQKRTAGMTSPYVFEGAVEILEVKPGGIFASLKMQKGDLLAAIIAPNDPWNITRVTDLKYLADHWTPEELGGNEVKVIVVRNKTLLEGKLAVQPKTPNTVPPNTPNFSVN